VSKDLLYLKERTTTNERGCWLWNHYVRADGYAVIGIRTSEGVKARYVHRLAFEAAFGPAPDGLQLDHLCRNRHCLNPLHLDPVTPRENTLRGTSPMAKNAAKTHCKHGHEFSIENTRIRPEGGRSCRTCERATLRRRRERIRSERKSA